MNTVVVKEAFWEDRMQLISVVASVAPSESYRSMLTHMYPSPALLNFVSQSFLEDISTRKIRNKEFQMTYHANSVDFATMTPEEHEVNRSHCVVMGTSITEMSLPLVIVE